MIETWRFTICTDIFYIWGVSISILLAKRRIIWAQSKAIQDTFIIQKNLWRNFNVEGNEPNVDSEAFQQKYSAAVNLNWLKWSNTTLLKVCNVISLSWLYEFQSEQVLPWSHKREALIRLSM